MGESREHARQMGTGLGARSAGQANYFDDVNVTDVLSAARNTRGVVHDSIVTQPQGNCILCTSVSEGARVCESV